MKTNLALSLAIILFSCEISTGSRILFLFPTPSKSHVIVAQALSTTLAEKGHDVTFVSSFPLSKPMKNHRDVVSPLRKIHADFASDMVKNPNQSMIKKFPEMLTMLSDVAQDMMTFPGFKKLLKEEFDLVIVGAFFNNYLLGYGVHFKCPTMMLSVSATMGQVHSLVGNPTGVSSVPQMMTTSKGGMNFLQRTANFLISGLKNLATIYFDHLQKQIYDQHFPSDRYVSYDHAMKNLSMILVNAHFSQGSPRPYVPAMVEIGGIQIKPKPDPLPNDLKTFLDGAKDGAIFFSFGSNAKTTYLPQEKVDLLLSVFSKLKQRIVMKWESDKLDGKPDNVFIGQWLPQDDILAHKNVKLFISHCGLGSMVESKYHGVPIVGIPIFADQDNNVETIVSEGWAIRVDLATMTENSLSDAIHEILSNPKYTSTVRNFANLYKDRPLSARETATYWVEYVIRHRGAPHLQYNDVHLNFFQSNSLDVIGLLIAVAYVAIKLTVLIFKFILSKLFGTPNMTKHNKTKKRN